VNSKVNLPVLKKRNNRLQKINSTFFQINVIPVLISRDFYLLYFWINQLIIALRASVAYRPFSKKKVENYFLENSAFQCTFSVVLYLTFKNVKNYENISYL